MNETIFISIVVGASVIVAILFNRHQNELRKEELVLELFSPFIFRKTMEELLKTDPSAPLSQDGAWILEHERELVDRHGSQWIAVVNAEVLVTATTGEKAWDEAIAKHPSRVPFVKKLNLEHINFDAEK